jgi:hypothetical protein
LHGELGQKVNSVDNLRYGTVAENMADRHRDGTVGLGKDSHAAGERNPNAKLTESQVRYLRQQLENGPFGTAAKLARELGLNKATVGKIKRGESWSWLAT